MNTSIQRTDGIFNYFLGLYLSHLESRNLVKCSGGQRLSWEARFISNFTLTMGLGRLVADNQLSINLHHGLHPTLYILKSYYCLWLW